MVLCVSLIYLSICHSLVPSGVLPPGVTDKYVGLGLGRDRERETGVGVDSPLRVDNKDTPCLWGGVWGPGVSGPLRHSSSLVGHSYVVLQERDLQRLYHVGTVPTLSKSVRVGGCQTLTYR